MPDKPPNNQPPDDSDNDVVTLVLAELLARGIESTPEDVRKELAALPAATGEDVQNSDASFRRIDPVRLPRKRHR